MFDRRMELWNLLLRTARDPDVAPAAQAVAKTTWDLCFAANEHPEFAAVPGWFWRHIATGVQNPMTVSYPERPEDVKDDRRRREMRWGAFLRRMIHRGYFSFSKEESDAFCSALGARATPPRRFTFEIVAGAAIVDAHCVGPYTCLTGQRVLVTWFAENAAVRLVKVYRGARYIARAMLWTTDDGAMCLDCIFPNAGAHVAALVDHARAQGWDHLTIQRGTQPFVSGKHYTVTLIA